MSEWFWPHDVAMPKMNRVRADSGRGECEAPTNINAFLGLNTMASYAKSEIRLTEAVAYRLEHSDKSYR
jgi:hypothetical protein